MNKHTNEIQSIDVLYTVNAKKEPAGSSKSPEVSTPPTGSAISISNLLNYVNNYFPDILPQSVLNHYGYSSRPEGNIGESALFSRDVDYAEGVLLFLIKSAYINKKEDDMSFKTGTVKHGAPSDISSPIYSLLNKLQNVNNNDTKLSRDVNMDSRRNFSNALSKAEFREFYSIFDNKENGRIINNSAVIIKESKIDNTKLICYNGNSKSPVITAIYRLLNDDETIHEENNLSARIIAKAEERGYSNEEIIRLLKANIEYYGYVLEKYDTESGGFRSLTESNQRNSRNFENSTDGRGIQQKDKYANFSRDVDYAEYAELKRENKHLKEINEVLKHQFELTNGREVSIKAC